MTGKTQDIGALFANLTCMFEDTHMIAVEGQASDLSRDEHLALVQQLQRQMRRTDHQMTAISEALSC